MKFKERFLAGEIEFEEIDDYIVEWNNSDTTETLAKFLGLNGEEEAKLYSLKGEMKNGQQQSVDSYDG